MPVVDTAASAMPSSPIPVPALPAPAAKPPARRLWLDLLPSELRVRVALHVSRGRHTTAALHLAETNALQCAAVLLTLSYRLVFSDPALAARWTAVFARQVRHVAFDRYVSFPAHASPHPYQLLQAPALRVAAVRGQTAELVALAGSKSLRELTVVLPKDSDFELLLDILRTLCIKKLSLLCVSEGKRFCPVKKIVQANDNPDALAISCPQLTGLRVACWHRDPLWKLLPTFPALREITLETRVQVAALPLLSTLDAVHIRWAPASLYVAEQLGSAVSSILTKECLLRADVQMLGARCPRLLKLNIAIHEDATVALVDAVRSMSSLRSLRVRWGAPAVSVKRTYKWNLASFSNVAPGLLLRTVEHLPDLVDLELLCVRINIAELTSILRKLGRQLHHFSTSVADQDESPFDRLDAVLTAVTEFNSGLHDFSIDVQRTDEMSLLGTMQHEDPEKRLRQGRVLAASLRRLSRAAPALNTEEISNWMGWYFLT